jgi:antitoxin component of RelBE/YafQ-DinJ toxin-antitoxin module
MQTMLSIKIEKSLKEQAQELAGILGVSLNAVINGYIKEFLSERKVTFADHPMPNTRTLKILKRLSADVRAGRNTMGPFNTAEEVIKSLRS